MAFGPSQKNHVRMERAFVWFLEDAESIEEHSAKPFQEAPCTSRRDLSIERERDLMVSGRFWRSHTILGISLQFPMD